MALELGSHPKPAQIAEALVYVGGYLTGLLPVTCLGISLRVRLQTNGTKECLI